MTLWELLHVRSDFDSEVWWLDLTCPAFTSIHSFAFALFEAAQHEVMPVVMANWPFSCHTGCENTASACSDMTAGAARWRGAGFEAADKGPGLVQARSGPKPRWVVARFKLSVAQLYAYEAVGISFGPDRYSGIWWCSHISFSVFKPACWCFGRTHGMSHLAVPETAHIVEMKASHSCDLCHDQHHPADCCLRHGSVGSSLHLPSPST